MESEGVARSSDEAKSGSRIGTLFGLAIVATKLVAPPLPKGFTSRPASCCRSNRGSPNDQSHKRTRWIRQDDSRG